MANTISTNTRASPISITGTTQRIVAEARPLPGALLTIGPLPLGMCDQRVYRTCSGGYTSPPSAESILGRLDLDMRVGLRLGLNAKPAAAWGRAGLKAHDGQDAPALPDRRPVTVSRRAKPASELDRILERLDWRCFHNFA